MTTERRNEATETITVWTATIEPDNGTGSPILTFVARTEDGAWGKVSAKYDIGGTNEDVKASLANSDIYVTVTEHTI